MNQSKILTDYIINPETCILLPAKQIEYDTIVFEQDKQFFVKKTAVQLIEEACLRYGSTFEGRRKAAAYQTDFKRKTPIPISIRRDIYVSPTHAVKDYDCIWVFSNHVRFTKPIPPKKKNGREKSMIVFKNNLELALDVSHHIMQTQMERAAICRYIFTDGIEY